MRKTAVVLGILGGILVLALVAIRVLADPNRHREVIQARLEKQLGRKVTLGEMSLGVLPLRFQVENPVIAEDRSIGFQQPFVRAEKLDVQIGLLPLLGGNVRIDSLELLRPKGSGIFRRSAAIRQDLLRAPRIHQRARRRNSAWRN